MLAGSPLTVERGGSQTNSTVPARFPESDAHRCDARSFWNMSLVLLEQRWSGGSRNPAGFPSSPADIGSCLAGGKENPAGLRLPPDRVGQLGSPSKCQTLGNIIGIRCNFAIPLSLLPKVKSPFVLLAAATPWKKKSGMLRCTRVWLLLSRNDASVTYLSCNFTCRIRILPSYREEEDSLSDGFE